MFALELNYRIAASPQYNGNIASMEWNTAMFGLQYYQFFYDGANRITNAYTTNHTTSYSYDKNGNIEKLLREGVLGGSSNYGMIDSLVYTYQGNQLLSVNDVNDPNHQNNGFTDDGSFLTTEYHYDNNGNMIADSNKHLSISKYNHLNLPEQLNLNPPQHYYEISYLYTAAGQKLHKATHIDFTPATTTDYVGSFIYQDDLLQSILTHEGRVVVDGSSYEYQYFLKDHLGNNRITFNESGTIIQEDSYYPYGMNMAGLSHESGVDLPNKYLYNGKELQDDFGLDWYDYGARFYDAEIGRWHVVDALAEGTPEYTPYRYAFNNPIRYIDPDGNFELDKATAKKYPRLANYLKHGIQGITSNARIMSGLKKFGQLTATNVANDVRWGKGPKIVVQSLVGSNGQFRPNIGSNILTIDKGIIEQLENALISGSDEALLLVASTILHEYVHYGDDQDEIDYPGEEGQKFEEFVYGLDIDNLIDAKKVIDAYKKRQEAAKKKKEEENRKRQQGLTSLLSKFDTLESGTYIWNGSAWIKK